MGVAGLVVCAGCAALGPRPAEVLFRGDSPPGTLAYLDAPRVASFGGEPQLLRLNSRRELVFRKGILPGEERVVSEESPRPAQISLTVLHTDAQGVYLFWRPKLIRSVEGVGRPGDKFVYFRASHDGGKTFGKTHRLNQAGGAFLPRVASNGLGDLYAAWVDERHGTRYDLYLNVSHDAGRTWKGEDLKLDPGPPGSTRSVDPSLAAEGHHVWAAWLEAEDGFTLYVRSSRDRGADWEAPVVVDRLSSQPTNPTLLRAKGQLLLYWYDEEGIRGKVSRDEGRTWERIPPLPGSEGAEELAVTADASGTVQVVYAAKPGDHEKADLFYTRAEDGTRFSPPLRLDTDTPHLATSTLPAIAVSPRGKVLVAWQDFRHFRPAIYANLSDDGGRSWRKADFSLEERPGAGFSFFPSVAASGDGRFAVAWVSYREGRLQEGEAVFRVVDPDQLVTPAIEKPDPARLAERVAAYWNARIAGEWGECYQFMDPFFREKNTREAYAVTQGEVKYYAYRVQETRVTDRVASVRVFFTHEVPKLELLGQVYRVPKREDETLQEWIWIEGDWYLVFKDVAGQSFFRY